MKKHGGADMNSNFMAKALVGLVLPVIALMPAGCNFSVAGPGLGCDGDGDCEEGYCNVETGECVACLEDGHCDDRDDCTTDACVDGACVFEPIPGCGAECLADEDCDDGDECTANACVDGACAFEPIPGCGAECLADEDCDDGDECTTNACVDGACVFEPIPGCGAECAADEDCDDTDECTEDACVDGICVHDEIPDCGKCLEEGEVGALDGPPCCPGLVPIDSEQFDPESGECLAESAYICSDCGNGNCEEWENLCNCPEDCKGPEPGCDHPCDCYEMLGKDFPFVCPPMCNTCGPYWTCVAGECVGECGEWPAEIIECAGLCYPEGTHFQLDDGAPNAICCPGLTAVDDTFPVEPAGSDWIWECESFDCACYVCTACGDGECGVGENCCNCFEDCDCYTFVDCDDNDDCTKDLCTAGMCVHEPIPGCKIKCGSPFGPVSCPEGSYCKFPAGTCDMEGMGGECTPIPELCPELWAPVCACSGLSYANECEMEAAQESKDHDGECDAECIGKGQSYDIFQDPEAECCPPLKAVSASGYVEGMGCVALPGGTFWCLACGDGLCEAPEDECLCPEDCEFELPCIPEGGSGIVVPDATPCCDGLTSIGCDAPGDDGLCEACGGGFYCTYCGDGECNEPENYCNCPADCQAPQPECDHPCDCYEMLGKGFPFMCPPMCPTCGPYWTCVAGECVEKCGEWPVEIMECAGLCYPEGTHFQADEGNPDAICCPGLTAVEDTFPVETPEPPGWYCEGFDCPCFVCTACGDGVCGPGENGCNCPQDCPGLGCQPPAFFQQVELVELLDSGSPVYDGKPVAVAGTVSTGPVGCTMIECPPGDPCCNACGAGLELTGPEGGIALVPGEVSPVGCNGNECDFLQNCTPFPPNSDYLVWGVFKIVFGQSQLALDGHCEN